MNAAPLDGPTAGKLELFMNEDSRHSVATPPHELNTGLFSIDVDVLVMMPLRIKDISKRTDCK